MHVIYVPVGIQADLAGRHGEVKLDSNIDPAA